MNKEAIKNKLILMQENIIKELQEKIEFSHSLVDIDEEDTHDPEDFSHQYESGEIEQLMRVQLNKANRSLERIKSIDFSAKDCVSLGALVKTDHYNFLVGQATIPFDVEGNHIIGISPASPIYSVMVNKKTGESFSFCGVNYQIESIL